MIVCPEYVCLLTFFVAFLGRKCLIKPTSVFGRDNEQRKRLQDSTKSPQPTTRGARQSRLASPRDKASKDAMTKPPKRRMRTKRSLLLSTFHSFFDNPHT